MAILFIVKPVLAKPLRTVLFIVNSYYGNPSIYNKASLREISKARSFEKA